MWNRSGLPDVVTAPAPTLSPIGTGALTLGNVLSKAEP